MLILDRFNIFYTKRADIVWYGFKTEYLCYYCKLYKTTIEEISVKHKISLDIINKFLNNDTSLTIAELLKIAQILNINIVELFVENSVPSKILKFD